MSAVWGLPAGACPPFLLFVTTLHGPVVVQSALPPGSGSHLPPPLHAPATSGREVTQAPTVNPTQDSDSSGPAADPGCLGITHRGHSCEGPVTDLATASAATATGHILVVRPCCWVRLPASGAPAPFLSLFLQPPVGSENYLATSVQLPFSVS